MGIENRPQRGRPKISAREAARILQRDVRTIRRMIEAGDIAGGATEGPKQKRWWVYVDQLPHPAQRAAASDEHDMGSASATIEALRAENLDLRVQLSAANETNQLLLAAQANMLEAVEQYRQSAAETVGAADGYRQAADGYRDAADRYSRATAGFQNSAEQLMAVVDRYRDALTQHTAPAHPADTTR
ncbi:hypothetical protein [Mycolicibacterium fortuitum]